MPSRTPFDCPRGLRLAAGRSFARLSRGYLSAMSRLRHAAALCAALVAGGGLVACSDRQNGDQGNNGGKPVGVTSPSPQSTGGTGSGAGAPPPSATSTVGTLPDQSSSQPPTNTDNPQPGGGDESGDAGEQPGG